MKPARLGLVLEQVLGHVAYTRTLERTLAAMTEVAAEVVRVHPSGRPSLLPACLDSWSVEASWSGRRAARRLLAGGAEVLFFHTQTLTLLSGEPMRRVPAVISLDATPANYDEMAGPYAHRRRAAPLEGAKMCFYRAVFARAAVIVAWSRWVERSLVGAYRVPADRVRRLPPGVDLRRFRPADRREPGPPRLLFVGADFERKGGRLLLEALAGLEADLEVDVVSAVGPSAVAGPGIHHHGDLGPESDELVRLYRRADAFVLPTLGDCYPIAVLEAMASGLPVVTTNVGGLGEMVREGSTAIVVEPGSARSLRAALEALLARPELGRSLGVAGRRLAERDHDAEANNRRLVELLAGLAIGSRQRPAAARERSQAGR